jgi:hypothetical protein
VQTEHHKAVHLLSDAGVDPIKDAGNAHKDSWFEGAHVVEQRFRVALPVPDRAAQREKRLLCHPIEDVRKWQIRQEHIRAPALVRAEYTLYARCMHVDYMLKTRLLHVEYNVECTLNE